MGKHGTNLHEVVGFGLAGAVDGSFFLDGLHGSHGLGWVY